MLHSTTIFGLVCHGKQKNEFCSLATYNTLYETQSHRQPRTLAASPIVGMTHEKMAKYVWFSISRRRRLTRSLTFIS